MKKKIYTTIAVMMVASFAFAQIAPRELRFYNVKADTSKPVPKKVNTPSFSKTNYTFWFNYGDAIMNYESMDAPPNRDYSIMLQDSIALVKYSNGDGVPQFYSFAQIFDFTDEFWDDAYRFGENVPSLRTANEFTIDSVSITYGYMRGSKVPESIVDTLVITIAAPSGEFDYGMVYDIAGEPAFSWTRVPYNLNDATIANTDFSRYYTYKYPLTVNDDGTVDDGYFGIADLTIPIEGFANMNNKQFVISYSYLSGVPNRTLESVYGEDISAFYGFYHEEPRSGYYFGEGNAVEETNISMVACDWSVQGAGNSIFYGYYLSNVAWAFEENGMIQRLKRPMIYFHVTCADCLPNNVKENDTKSISVRPNPATNNFTVTLADAGTAQVELFNLVGQKVYGTTTADQMLNINVSNYNNGIYMLKVTQNGKIHTSKVVVK